MLAAQNVVIEILCLVIRIYAFVLLARVLWSWFRPPITQPWRGIYGLLHEMTDPVLRPLARLIPPVQAGATALDLSPMIAFVILIVLQQAICFR